VHALLDSQLTVARVNAAKAGRAIAAGEPSLLSESHAQVITTLRSVVVSNLAVVHC
jgi:hypothetical protein